MSSQKILDLIFNTPADEIREHLTDLQAERDAVMEDYQRKIDILKTALKMTEAVEGCKNIRPDVGTKRGGARLPQFGIKSNEEIIKAAKQEISKHPTKKKPDDYIDFFPDDEEVAVRNQDPPEQSDWYDKIGLYLEMAGESSPKSIAAGIGMKSDRNIYLYLKHPRFEKTRRGWYVLAEVPENTQPEAEPEPASVKFEPTPEIPQKNPSRVVKDIGGNRLADVISYLEVQGEASAKAIAEDLGMNIGSIYPYLRNKRIERTDRGKFRLSRPSGIISCQQEFSDVHKSITANV